MDTDTVTYLSNMPLWISEEEVAKAVSADDIILAIEDGFRQHGLGLAQTLPRREVRIRNKELLHADPRMVKISQGLALLEESGVAIVSHLFNFPDIQNPYARNLRHVIDAKDGHVIAVVDSTRLGIIRTGAAAAVGAKFLSRKDSHVVGMIGAGKQASSQLKCLTRVREITKALVYARDSEKLRTFCKEMEQELGIDVFPAQNISDVTRASDILVTVTPATDPFIEETDLYPGVHVNIVGADDEKKMELTGKALKKADKLVFAAEDCFDIDQIRIPLKRGEIQTSDVYGTIGQVIAGVKPGRETQEEITIFHSPGVTVQDAASGYMAYKRAEALGLGKRIPDAFKPS